MKLSSMLISLVSGLIFFVAAVWALGCPVFSVSICTLCVIGLMYCFLCSVFTISENMSEDDYQDDDSDNDSVLIFTLLDEKGVAFAESTIAIDKCEIDGDDIIVKGKNDDFVAIRFYNIVKSEDAKKAVTDKLFKRGDSDENV